MRQDAPKFRRLRCDECGRVVPWSWLTGEDRRAAMTIDGAGKPTVRCNAHDEKCPRCGEPAIYVPEFQGYMKPDALLTEMEDHVCPDGATGTEQADGTA